MGTRVTVLLSTYNGSRFLKKQIASLCEQKDVEVSILVRDDGSTDDTQDLLKEYKEEGVLDWYSGPNLKPAKSFIDLILNAPESDYYAFCDQDDVWLTDKLSVAVGMLKEEMADFYYSSYTTVDSNLNILAENVSHSNNDSLGVSFIDLNVTGCTVVFSRKLLEKARLYKPDYIMMHDSWLYKIALALGYKVVYDPIAHIYYRQHGNNVIGDKQNFMKKNKARYNRWIKNVTNNRYQEVEELYKGYYSEMVPGAKDIILKIIGYKEKNFIERWLVAIDRSFRTGNKNTDIKFALSIIFKRF